MQDKTSQPGRPRSFDESETLSKAVTVFWENGFVGASYSALEEATGLHRQSLRYAFGDKDRLFEQVVSHYAERKIEEVVRLLTRPRSPLDNIRSVFALWATDARHPSRRGCLMVNVLAELGSSDKIAIRAIALANRRLIDAFERAFRDARREGEIRADLDARALAVQALALGDGLLLHSRSQDGDPQVIAALESWITMVAR